MGFRKPLDLNQMTGQIATAYYEMKSPYNDGFTTFEIKKDLYRLKWQLDRVLESAPTFYGEDQWLEEQEKEHVWNELKK